MGQLQNKLQHLLLLELSWGKYTGEETDEVWLGPPGLPLISGKIQHLRFYHYQREHSLASSKLFYGLLTI